MPYLALGSFLSYLTGTLPVAPPHAPAQAKLAVSPGVTVIVGHSGAGKTTLLRCIAGLSNPEEGRIARDAPSGSPHLMHAMR